MSLVSSEAFSVRAIGARYPSVLLGLRWEVVLGRWSLGFFGRHENKTVVIERRDGKAVYVRAGVGTVVNVAQGWAAVAGCRLVAIYDLTNGRELLRTTFDPRPLGSLWLGVAEERFAMAVPDGDLVVFAPDVTRMPVMMCEVSRHDVGEDACYAVSLNMIAIALLEQVEAG